MALTAVQFRLRASEAKDAARTSPDEKLSDLFLEIAQSYEALAENEDWLEGKRNPVARTKVVAKTASVSRPSGSAR